MYSANRGPEGFVKRIRETRKEIPPRVWVELDSAAFYKNYNAIQELVPDQAMLPMVKANAYGHGLEWATALLSGCSNLYGIGVATLDEGARVRNTLGARKRKIPILIFTESLPWSDEKGAFCEEYGLTAVIASEADWLNFLRKGWTKRIPYEIQINTGMNRLGIPINFARTIVKDLKNSPSEEHPTGVFSHFAMSEESESQLTQAQLEKFRWIRQELGSAFPGTRYHFANSGAIWNFKNLGLKDLTDVVRPGLSLYGVPPWPGAPRRGLADVLTYQAQIIAVHRLKPGDSIGYGASYTVSGKEPVYAAIIAAGYADGVMRSLSNQGYAWLNGKETRFLGRVSMDLSAVQCSSDTKVGSTVQLIGPQVDIWAQARAAGTIPYELLTSISPRVKRVYD